jgi:hypothetical protein
VGVAYIPTDEPLLPHAILPVYRDGGGLGMRLKDAALEASPARCEDHKLPGSSSAAMESARMALEWPVVYGTLMTTPVCRSRALAHIPASLKNNTR